MALPPRSNLKRYTFGLLAASSLVGAVAVSTGTAISQGATCTGDHIATTDGAVITSFDDAGLGFATSRTYATSIPAGQYDLNAHSSDAYAGRAATETQTSEQWFAEILDAQGNVLATSSATADLADGLEAASWAGGIGLVSLSADATAIRVVHAHQTTAETNSVHPTCVGFAAYEEPTPSTTVPQPEVEPEPEPQAEVQPPAPVDLQPLTAVAGVTENARPAFTG